VVNPLFNSHYQMVNRFNTIDRGSLEQERQRGCEMTRRSSHR
jgi:hypothetical protein